MNDVQKMTDIVAKFVSLIGKKLPDDIMQKLTELRAKETVPIANTIYDSMFHNMERALELNRPMCQDTGVIQFFVKVGTKFPLIDDLQHILRQAVIDATIDAPLRHNAVETFDEYNTKQNVGSAIPLVDIELIPGSDRIEIEPYMAGGGCTLPGAAKVLMPSEGYEGLLEFVFDVMTQRGLNACPPLLVGIGVATSAETAAMLSKKALLRPIGSRSKNARAAELEETLEREFNALGLGPQGLTGNSSVMGVHIENAARHPSTIGVAISTGCWAHRRGHIVIGADLSYEIISHRGAAL